MYDALYGRQSIEKKDSISIESQIEYCKYETHGEPYQVYTDKGFSGKDTNRPDFERLMADIKAGKVKRVIVYKLDRISRSILDFATMMETFQKYNVEFVSSTEKFDTSTPIGRAMLNICIVFAQLERETIQKRVTDAYYSRSKRGFYMGGRVPYGFQLKKTEIDGIKTSMYIPVPEESEQIQLMYSLYADPTNSLGDIIRYFNEYGIKHLRDGQWSTARMSDMLRNPVYVKADVDVYEFFRSQGANVINPVTDFTGYNACYLYKGTVSSTRKQSDLTDKEIVLAPHEGIVCSSDWIKCRIRCLNNRQSTRTFKGKNSWLLGKVKCGNCKYSLNIAKSDTKWKRYFVCGNRLATKGAGCKGTGGTIYADVLEAQIAEDIKKKLSEFETLSGETANKGQKSTPMLNENKIRITQIETEIEELLAKVGEANSVLMQYINEKVEALDRERKQLQEQVVTASSNSEVLGKAQTLSRHVELWEQLSFEDKQAVVDALVKVIYVANNKVDITWNI